MREVASHARTLPVHIRSMIRRDLDEVAAIETAAFEFPWGADDFVQCLRQRRCICMAAERDERVAGFMVYELHRGALQLLNLAVHPDFRGQGVGRQMVAKLIGKLETGRRTRLVTEVRETNLAAQLFFRACGLRAVAVWHDFYEGCADDAYVFEHRLGEQLDCASLRRARFCFRP